MSKQLNVLSVLAACIWTLPLNTVLADSTNQAPLSQTQTLQVGAIAPDFTRPYREGKISLKDFAGKKCVILYFYPKDETPGCTKEACTFRDSYSKLQELGAEVIGVSGDSDASHASFAKDHELQFVLLSDSDDSLMKLYHVPAVHGSLHARITFVIDKHGIIRGVFKDLPDAAQHVSEAISLVEKSNKEQ